MQIQTTNTKTRISMRSRKKRREKDNVIKAEC